MVEEFALFNSVIYYFLEQAREATISSECLLELQHG